VRKKLAAGKWLQRAVQKRNQTLYRLTEFVLKKQEAFFQEDQGRLIPMTTAEAALELGLHESTVARAVAHKFIACPQGLFALRSFFRQGIRGASKKSLSSVSLKELLEGVIEKEDKTKPFSDEEISLQLKQQGIPCARRTVAKYRTALHIAPASRRRTWS
jgi:RNA polymerase sigma-54 factor